MKELKFVVYQDVAGGWRWKLKATNGKVIADSGEAYVRKSNAINAIHLIMDWAAAAVVIEEG